MRRKSSRHYLVSGFSLPARRRPSTCGEVRHELRLLPANDRRPSAPAEYCAQRRVATDCKYSPSYPTRLPHLGFKFPHGRTGRSLWPKNRNGQPFVMARYYRSASTFAILSESFSIPRVGLRKPDNCLVRQTRTWPRKGFLGRHDTAPACCL